VATATTPVSLFKLLIARCPAWPELYRSVTETLCCCCLCCGLECFGLFECVDGCFEMCKSLSLRLSPSHVLIPRHAVVRLLSAYGFGGEGVGLPIMIYPTLVACITQKCTATPKKTFPSFPSPACWTNVAKFSKSWRMIHILHNSVPDLD
jgi:hypothetical protein